MVFAQFWEKVKEKYEIYKLTLAKTIGDELKNVMCVHDFRK
jgi:hypothetical protein